VNNLATEEGGGVKIWEPKIPQLMNFIIWRNTAPADSQISGIADVQYSDVESGESGTFNIDLDPEFYSSNPHFALSGTSPCIDAGNPDPMYYDIENPNNPGNSFWPALGTVTNDMGPCCGPASLWRFCD